VSSFRVRLIHPGLELEGRLRFDWWNCQRECHGQKNEEGGQYYFTEKSYLVSSNVVKALHYQS